MAESEEVIEMGERGEEGELTGEFRRRSLSFHCKDSKAAPKRPATDEIDEALPTQRKRVDEHRESSASTGSITNEATDTEGNPIGTESPESLAARSTTTGSSSPEIVPYFNPQGRPRLVRPEDISLHNPDSGLGFRGSHKAYNPDESDEDLELDLEEVDDEESEKEDGEVTEPDEAPTANSSPSPRSPRSPRYSPRSQYSPSPDRGDSSTPTEDEPRWIPQSPILPEEYPIEEEESITTVTRYQRGSPRSPTPIHQEEEEEEEVVEEVEAEVPYNNQLSLNTISYGFDPTEHTGLLMIAPSHQTAFFNNFRAEQALFFRQQNHYIDPPHTPYEDHGEQPAEMQDDDAEPMETVEIVEEENEIVDSPASPTEQYVVHPYGYYTD